MRFRLYIILIVFFCQSNKMFSQGLTDVIVAKDTIKKTIDPLAPSKAAFYSAILPGLGQAYNKKYWNH